MCANVAMMWNLRIVTALKLRLISGTLPDDKTGADYTVCCTAAREGKSTFLSRRQCATWTMRVEYHDVYFGTKMMYCSCKCIHYEAHPTPCLVLANQTFLSRYIRPYSVSQHCSTPLGRLKMISSKDLNGSTSFPL
jgi:hypothetical protein